MMKFSRLLSSRKPEKEKVLPAKRQQCRIGLLPLIISATLGMIALATIYAKTQESSLLPVLDMFHFFVGTKHVAACNCETTPQATPVFAHEVEGMMYPFIVSLTDLGSPEKPNRNFERLSKGKKFQRFPVSHLMQRVLRRLRPEGPSENVELVIDVGANVGMATFAAAAMGYRVLAFEPILENVQKLCDGVHLNRVGHLVTLYHSAVSDMDGNVTMHKVLGRLDNSAVSANGATHAFPSNKVVPVSVQSTTLDSVVQRQEPILLLKIDVQGHEFQVLKGAINLLSRPGLKAPLLVYEEDEGLLHENNSSSRLILQFLEDVGYKYCRREEGDRHCFKSNIW